MPKWRLNKATKRLCPNKFRFIFTTQSEALHYKATTESICQVVVVSQNALKTQEVSTISTNDVCYWIIEWLLLLLLGKSSLCKKNLSNLNFAHWFQYCLLSMALNSTTIKFAKHLVFKNLISVLIASFFFWYY